MRGAIHVKCARTCRGKQTDIDHPVHEGVRFFTLFHVIKLQRLIYQPTEGVSPFHVVGPKRGGGVKIADIQV